MGYCSCEGWSIPAPKARPGGVTICIWGERGLGVSAPHKGAGSEGARISGYLGPRLVPPIASPWPLQGSRCAGTFPQPRAARHQPRVSTGDARPPARPRRAPATAWRPPRWAPEGCASGAGRGARSGPAHSTLGSVGCDCLPCPQVIAALARSWAAGFSRGLRSVILLG